MARRIQTITFDLDDTLWAVAPVITAAEQHCYNWLLQHCPKIRQHFSPETWQQFKHQLYHRRPDLHHQISQLRRVAIREALISVGYQQGFAEQQAERAFEIFLHARHQVQLFAGVEPLLQQLHRHYRLGVLTNGNADIRRLPIGKYFDFAFSAEQLNASKPAADLFLAAARHCAINPSELVHIGDHWEHDVLGAIQAGCRAIWFNPDRRPPPTAISAAYQITQLSELPGLIGKLSALAPGHNA